MVFKKRGWREWLEALLELDDDDVGGVSDLAAVVVFVDVPDGALEPLARVEQPPEHDEAEDDAERDGRVVEGVHLDRVHCGEQEHGAGVADPQEGDEADGPACAAEVEWPWPEVVLPHHHAREDGHRVAAHPPDGGDGGDGREHHVDAQDGQAQQRAHRRAQPHRVRRHPVPRVDPAPHRRQRHAPVPRQRVHHPRRARRDGQPAEEEGSPDDEQQHDGARRAAVPPVERVVQDLRRHERAGGLVARVVQVAEVLDAEGERQDVRPAEDGDDADAGEDGDGPVLVGAFGLLRQVRRRVVPVQRVLAHEEGQDDGVGAAADPRHVGRRLEMGEHVRRRLRRLGHQREHDHDHGATDHLRCKLAAEAGQETRSMACHEMSKNGLASPNVAAVR